MKTIVNSNSQAQITAPQVWDKPTVQAKVGDYIRIPCTPVMQVVDKDTLEDGRVWLLVKPMSGSYSEEWIVEPELPALTQQLAHLPETECQQQQQPVGFAGDSVSVGLQPTRDAIAEFDTGRCHGREDAFARLHPLYTQLLSEYAAGYLEGYNSVLNPSPQTEVIEPVGWSVRYNANWGWYDVWVASSCCLEKGSSYEEAERIAQHYIAASHRHQEHRRAVLAAYAG
jgi:hypothetical protein